MNISTILFAGLVAAFAPAAAHAQRDAVKALPADFGVPKSPAFELLGSTPDMVPHVVTPHDLQGNVASFFQGTHLQQGASFDVRPFAAGVGSLRRYQVRPARQWLWRTVAAVGTTAASKASKDVSLAAGVRLPLIDRGDPRADSALTNSMERACTQLLKPGEQPDFNIGLDGVTKLYARCSTVTDSLRKSYVKKAFGALRLDVGLGGSWRARGGDVHPDSIVGSRAGAWVGLQTGLSKSLRVTLGAKGIRVHPDSATAESGRYSLGARTEWFASSSFSLSAEASGVWARYRDSTRLNESWMHPAIVAEWAAPFLGGWVGAAYGGDTAHRSKSDAKLSFFYAFYKDRVMSP